MRDSTVVSGYIYRLSSKESPQYYLGSTTRKLRTRLMAHRDAPSSTRVKEWMDLIGGMNNVDIIEIESCKDITYRELKEREADHIREHIKDTNCLNQQIPYRTAKEWREENKEKQKEYFRRYDKESNNRQEYRIEIKRR